MASNDQPHRQRSSERMKRLHADQTFAARCSARMAALHRDPAFLAARGDLTQEQRAAVLADRRSRPEIARDYLIHPDTVTKIRRKARQAARLQQEHRA